MEANRDTVMETTAASVDGRTRRRRRNIDAVVDAVIELAQSGNLDPTSEEIAAVAGISHRSIYRYFDSRADLLDAAIIRAFDLASSGVTEAAPVGRSFDERAERFIVTRVAVYERFRAVARAAWAHAVGEVRPVGMTEARSRLRAQMEHQFATELERFDHDERRLVVSLVDATFQFESLEYLSEYVDLDAWATRQSLLRHLRCHLRPV